MPATCTLMALVALFACNNEPAEAPVAAPAPDAAEVPSAPVARPGLLSEEQFAALHELKEEEAPPAKGITVEVGGMNAYLSLPEGTEGSAPGVVLVHEWWGLNSHIRYWADRLATQGYAALAVDLYDGTVATEPDQAMAAMKAVDEAAALEKLKAAHAFLVSDERVQAPRTGVIGWCFGGGWSLRLAVAEPELDAAVMYYGRLIEDDAELQKLNAPLLGVFGSQDKGIPVDAVKAFETKLKGLGKNASIQIYDAGHAFANPSSGRYAAVPAEQAWEEVAGFFKRNLGP